MTAALLAGLAPRARDNRRVCLTRQNGASLLEAPAEVPERRPPSARQCWTYLQPPLCGRATGQASRARRCWADARTLGGGEYVARSALGENAAGELIFAAGMSTTPADLAAALVRSGARTAIELDINPEWVQLDVARRAGRGLRAAIPGQVRPADQYLIGWTRDFIAVLAARPGGVQLILSGLIGSFNSAASVRWHRVAS